MSIINHKITADLLALWLREKKYAPLNLTAYCGRQGQYKLFKKLQIANK